MQREGHQRREARAATAIAATVALHEAESRLTVTACADGRATAAPTAIEEKCH